jgi:thiosulfate/3-mercaptopyruvate sulfurtransferase
LAALLDGPAPPTVLDVRWQLGGPPGRSEYEQGHVPGAAFVDLDTELAGPAGAGGRHPLPDPETFEGAMRAAGVSADRPVVVYDAAGALSAARGWWTLRYFGHPNVAVLDGGLAAWVSAGGALERDPPEIVPGDFGARPGGMPVLDAAGARELAGGAGVLLDARAPERYRGEQEPIDPVAGHIPGAVNRPTTENVDAAGRFLEPAALRAGFEGAGVRTGVRVGAYCGSGVTAAHEVLALTVAGYRDAPLYVGSWSEWIVDPARPVARGTDAPGLGNPYTHGRRRSRPITKRVDPVGGPGSPAPRCAGPG